ncbi:acyltransferase [Arthrobacter sp. I2-34]|uniref:Acyltransferase n=1 Tax=Arthrobacter hankyongi TaxID=2904801 RepID=A0ABS9L6H4_9MICC|nr:acyltransferase [Arthrobacter hankyongi]MCG2622272.1 acyltransferase [Arthrobacter hankyongi]
MGTNVYTPEPALTRAAIRGQQMTGTRPSAAVPRFRLLDGLRFLAALAVVIYHFTARDNSAWGVPVGQVFPEFSKISAFGAFGVQLFFIISGFVILLSAWGRDVSSFTASRVGRLFPGYWAGVLLTSFLLLVLWPAGKDISLTQALVNLTMVQEGLGVGHVDGVYWTLWVELKFYLIIGILMAVGMTRVRVLVLCLLWPLIGAMAEETGNPLLANLLVPEFAPLFAGGMLIYMVYREGASVLLLLALGFNAILAGYQTLGGHAQAIEHAAHVTLAPPTVWITVIGLFVIVAAATLTRLNRVPWKFLSMAGSLTFPLYLIHEYWGWWFISLGSPHFPQLAVLPAVIALCLSMAWAVWRFVEKPINPLLRSAVQRGLDRLWVTHADERYPTAPK